MLLMRKKMVHIAVSTIIASSVTLKELGNSERKHTVILSFTSLRIMKTKIKKYAKIWN